jgi:hypothetical protein
MRLLLVSCPSPAPPLRSPSYALVPRRDHRCRACSGRGLFGWSYRVQAVAHEGEVVLVIRTNRITGRVDYAGPYGLVLKEFKDGDSRGRLW